VPAPRLKKAWLTPGFFVSSFWLLVLAGDRTKKAWLTPGFFLL